MVRCCGLFIEPISSEPYIIPAAMWAVKNDRSYKKRSVGACVQATPIREQSLAVAAARYT